jgi:hypothetical protein
MNKFYPIETAPKNRVILLARYEKEEWRWFRFAEWFGASQYNLRGGWGTPKDRFDPSFNGATHWSEIPPSPEFER